MNTLKVGWFRSVWRLAVLLALLVAADVRAAEPQSNRFLLVFETSPAFKRNLPAIRQTLGRLFASNLQNEIKTDDDLAVWTVDKELHTAAFPLDNWVPEEAGIYGDRLLKFLEDQSTSRHATLAALQPLLNRVVKDSQELTVLIFCDTESRLAGTPYDDGVNEIITNASAKSKGPAPLFIITLRSYHGEYLGCSVNRSGGLNFPKFPVPKPEPVKPLPAPKPEPVVIKTGPSLILVGTRAETNVPVAKPAIAAMSPPAPVSPPPVNVAVTAPATPATIAVAPKIVVPPVPPQPVPPVATAPVSAAPISPPVVPPAIQPPSPAPATTAVAPAPAKPAAPAPVAAIAPVVPAPVVPAAATNPPVAVVVPPAPSGGLLLPLALASVALLAAAVIILALVVRARRPQGSLITSSMQSDHEDRD